MCRLRGERIEQQTSRQPEGNNAIRYPNLLIMSKSPIEATTFPATNNPINECSLSRLLEPIRTQLLELNPCFQVKRNVRGVKILLQPH
jgi:hypothetical protein